jgi:hypothetical protein
MRLDTLSGATPARLPCRLSYASLRLPGTRNHALCPFTSAMAACQRHVAGGVGKRQVPDMPVDAKRYMSILLCRIEAVQPQLARAQPGLELLAVGCFPSLGLRWICRVVDYEGRRMKRGGCGIVEVKVSRATCRQGCTGRTSADWKALTNHDINTL